MNPLELQASFATSGISVNLQKDAQNKFYLVMTGGPLAEPLSVECSLLEIKKLARILNLSAAFIESSV